MDKDNILIILTIIIGISLISILIITNQVVEYKGLCVDGDGDVNLEGIMCEKSYDSFLGYSEKTSDLIHGSILIILIITTFTLMMGWILYE